MKTNKLGIISLGLWFVTITIFVYFLYFGKTSKSIDGRTTIHLTEEEKKLVLMEMRLLLKSVNGIISGISQNDYDKSALSASVAGMGLVESLKNEERKILLKLPAEFKKLGMGTHEQFDIIATKIKEKRDLQIILKELDLLTQKCVICHANYKIEAAISE